MKPIKSLALSLAGLALTAVVSHAQLTLNFASITGSTLQFNGASSSFQFNAPAVGTNVAPQWQIGSEAGGTGSAIGLFGVFNNGPFSYGSITTSLYPGLTVESASVIGPLGSLSVNDGGGDFLTGNVNWIQVQTMNSIGSLNGALSVNVTGLAYSGGNADLHTIVAQGPASMNISFQFAPTEMLSQLSSGTGPYNTSYSGSITVAAVPEPGTTVLAVMGGLFLAGWTVRRRHSIP